MVRILISYRRADSAAITGRIVDRLVDRYGKQSIFMDIDNIPYGEDFHEAISKFLEDCDIVLAIISPGWRGLRGSQVPRILEPEDPVRVEIETALAAGLSIVPVLVDGATMPSGAELPPSIEKLSFLNAATIDVGRDFNFHMAMVIDGLDEVLSKRGKLPAHARRTGSRHKISVLRLPTLVSIAAVTLASLSLPLGGSLASAAPAWPTKVTAITITSEVLLFAISLRLLIWRPSARNRSWLPASLFFAAAISSYFVLLAIFSFEIPGSKERWAKGFHCTAEAQLVYPTKCPYELDLDELRGAEYEAERLWTAHSVATIRLFLLGSWLCTFLAVAFLAANYVAGAITACVDEKPAGTRD
jgi:hypothetical protein